MFPKREFGPWEINPIQFNYIYMYVGSKACRKKEFETQVQPTQKQMNVKTITCKSEPVAKSNAKITTNNVYEWQHKPMRNSRGCERNDATQ